MAETPGPVRIRHLTVALSGCEPHLAVRRNHDDNPYRAIRIDISPFTTSSDITGSPDPSVVSPKRGPNLSFLVSGISDAIVPFSVTARMRASAGTRGNRTRRGPLNTRNRIIPPIVNS